MVNMSNSGCVHVCVHWFPQRVAIGHQYLVVSAILKPEMDGLGKESSQFRSQVSNPCILIKIPRWRCWFCFFPSCPQYCFEDPTPLSRATSIERYVSTTWQAEFNTSSIMEGPRVNHNCLNIGTFHTGHQRCHATEKHGISDSKKLKTKLQAQSSTKKGVYDV